MKIHSSNQKCVNSIYTTLLITETPDDSFYPLLDDPRQIQEDEYDRKDIANLSYPSLESE